MLTLLSRRRREIHGRLDQQGCAHEDAWRFLWQRRPSWKEADCHWNLIIIMCFALIIVCFALFFYTRTMMMQSG